MLFEDLQAAQADGAAVELRREELDEDRMGWVVGLGEEWVLLHQVSDRIWLDGYLAMRLEDIDAYRRLDEVDDGFVPRALALREQRPAVPDGVELGSLPSLLRSLGQRFPLVSLLFERDEEPYAVIGRIEDVSDTEVTVVPMTTSATFEDEREVLDFTEITSVVADAEYERALALVAGLG